MKVLAIHDLSGYGRASLTTIIPILATNGHQCIPVPTAIFSTHTAFTGFRMQDLSDFIDDYMIHYVELKIPVDCIYSGFLGSASQIDSVILACKKFPSAFVVVDPVMGDHGKVYKTYDDMMCKKMQDLVKYADLITPNITEANLLLGNTPSYMPKSEQEIEEILQNLRKITGKKIIITGIQLGDGNITTALYDDGNIEYFRTKYLHANYPGTGDLFTSVLISCILNGMDLKESIKISCDFVYKCILYTKSLNQAEILGVEFEQVLYKKFR